MTWLPSRNGKAIDLVEPTVRQVDFDDIAWSLANTNRFAGHANRPVSVALHTLIGLPLAPLALRPLWLLHDAAESRTGDLTSPAKEALAAIAGGRSKAALRAFTEVWEAFERRHDEVIHRAAGLAMPTEEERAAIKRIDLICLATEYRDFCQPPARSWYHEEIGIAPAKQAASFKPAEKAAALLADAFRTYLPALQPVVLSISAIRQPRRRAR